MKLHGPIGWRNWRASVSEEPILYTMEFPLFSDSWLVGQIDRGLGSYFILNTIRADRSPDYFPAAVLRAHWHLDLNDDLPPASEWTTEVDFYHAGDFADELTALLSLSLGARAQAGGQTRLFGSYISDPLGQPTAYHDKDVVRLPKQRRQGHPLLPYTSTQRDLGDVLKRSPLPGYASLNADTASALVQSARLCQEAVWIAEQRPEWSWVLLVSAIERGAAHWQNIAVDPVEWLSELEPSLQEEFKKAGRIDLLNSVAERVSKYLGSTKRFCQFVLEFLPDPPPTRPPEWYQYTWTRPSLESALKTIYQWRSRYLHQGIPFPAPMCDPPYREKGWSAFAEKPIGLATKVHGGTWLAKDTPIMLHVFEYIVRHALTKWWERMTPETGG